MKTPEDEAFDDIARRQGDWGGGFPAKRAMAADKLHWSDCAVHNGPAYPAGKCDCDARLSKYAETLLEEATRSCNNIDEQRALDALMLNFHKPTQEPVAWGWRYDSCGHAVVNRLVATETSKPTLFLKNVFARGPFPLYAAPPQREWVGLTDDELADLWYKESLDWMEFARAHEAALKEKNNG